MDEHVQEQVTEVNTEEEGLLGSIENELILMAKGKI